VGSFSLEIPEQKALSFNIFTPKMLSGVEIAGLVLAVLPLILEALEKYQHGLKKAKLLLRFREKDRERLVIKVDGLFSQLDFLRVHLGMHIKKLCLNADSNALIGDLPTDYKDILWTGPLGLKVEAYLTRIGGDTAAKTFQRAMNHYQNICIEIAEHIEGIVRPPQVSIMLAVAPKYDFLNPLGEQKRSEGNL
jgi:hypothetical protein